MADNDAPSRIERAAVRIRQHAAGLCGQVRQDLQDADRRAGGHGRVEDLIPRLRRLIAAVAQRLRRRKRRR